MDKEPNRPFVTLNCSMENDIATCASIIAKGGVLVFPTDTVYGIGCDPYNGKAVERIFAIKGRREDKPLPVLACSIGDVEKIASLGRIGNVLGRKFWPGGLTLVAPLLDVGISEKVTACKGSIAVRIPANRCILSLLGRCKYIVGTSANISGDKSMVSSKQILSSPLRGFDALLDGGTVDGGVESTIVDLTEPSTVKVVREGAIKSEQIYHVIENAM